VRDYFILAKQFTLGKAERLKSRKETEKLFSSGKKFSQESLRIFYQAEQNTLHPSLLFGAGVSTKNFKRATDRNRIKRMIRETYRLQKQSLQEKLGLNKIKLTVFFIYTGKVMPVYDELFLSMGKTLTKLDNILIKS
jgi:ribonuclease P protein component